MTRHLRLALASILAMASLGAIAPAANAYVYWANNGNGTIGRASLSSFLSDQSFITGADGPNGLAIDGRYIYWTNYGTDSIGRANLDGTSPNQSLITGATVPVGVAVDANYIYWAGYNGNIGRANLDGSNPDPTFINALSGPFGIAVDDNYIYWSSPFLNKIGRANLDGTGVDQSFITGASIPYGVAVDSSHVYWTNSSANAIGRANLDGSAADQSFVPLALGAFGIASDDRYIYWSNSAGNSIGRADLDGANPNQGYITGGNIPRAIALNTLPKPTISRFGKPTKRSIKVKIGCGDSGQCSLRITGKKVGTGARVRSRSAMIGPGGEKAILILTYTAALRKALARGGRVSVTASNEFTGSATSIVVRVRR